MTHILCLFWLFHAAFSELTFVENPVTKDAKAINFSVDTSNHTALLLARNASDHTTPGYTETSLPNSTQDPAASLLHGRYMPPKYTEKRRSDYTKEQQISNWIECNGQLERCTITKSYAVSDTVTWSTSLAISVQSVVTGTIGYSFSHEASVTNTYSFTLKPGETAAVFFRADRQKSEGDEYQDRCVQHNYACQCCLEWTTDHFAVQLSWPHKMANGDLSGTFFVRLK